MRGCRHSTSQLVDTDFAMCECVFSVKFPLLCGGHLSRPAAILSKTWTKPYETHAGVNSWRFGSVKVQMFGATSARLVLSSLPVVL